MPTNNEVQDLQEVQEQIEVQGQEDSKEEVKEDSKENIESVSESQNFTIIIDGQESNYLIESYKEMKVTNLYLQLILIAIVLIFVLSKFYYFCKSIFRVNF